MDVRGIILVGHVHLPVELIKEPIYIKRVIDDCGEVNVSIVVGYSTIYTLSTSEHIFRKYILPFMYHSKTCIFNKATLLIPVNIQLRIFDLIASYTDRSFTD